MTQYYNLDDAMTGLFLIIISPLLLLAANKVAAVIIGRPHP